MEKQDKKMFKEMRELWAKKYEEKIAESSDGTHTISSHPINGKYFDPYNIDLFDKEPDVDQDQDKTSSGKYPFFPAPLPPYGPLQVPATDTQSIINSIINREIKARIALKKLLLEDVGLDEKDADEIIRRVFEQ